MAGFLDFVQNMGDYVPGGNNAIPAWLTALLVKKPAGADPSAALPYYQAIAEQAARANEFAGQNADFFNQNYRPAAVNFNQRAQSVGGTADLNEAASRGGANFNAAYTTQRNQQKQSMAGVNPNSGAAMARKGALEASYAPGVVDAMNRARMGREEYGDKLRATAIPMLATTPNFGTGMTGAAMAGAGTAGVANSLYNQYRQQAGDVTKALKLPGDAADEAKRKTTTNTGTSSILDSIAKRFPSQVSMSNPNPDIEAPTMNAVQGDNIDMNDLWGV